MFGDAMTTTLRSILLAGAASAAMTLGAIEASALPTAPSTTIVTEQAGMVTPVANGCGRFFHYNWRLRRCVRN
jgi:hypothetical protein